MPPYRPGEKIHEKLDDKSRKLLDEEHVKKVEIPAHQRVVEHVQDIRAVVQSTSATVNGRTYPGSTGWHENPAFRDDKTGERVYYILKFPHGRSGLSMDASFVLAGKVTRPHPLIANQVITEEENIAFIREDPTNPVAHVRNQVRETGLGVTNHQTSPDKGYPVALSADSADFLTVVDTLNFLTGALAGQKAGQLATEGVS